MRLPDALFSDFAVARDGTIYAAAAPPPGPGPKTLILYALAPNGQIRWTEPTLMEEVEDHVRIGPDGTVYALSHLGGGWVPLATPTGQPLPLAEQRRRTSPQQPLAGGLRLAIASVSAHEQRFALINQAGQVVRAWQVTSRTDLEVALLATPALVGGDPVVVVDALQQTNVNPPWEHRVLRLALTGGASVRFTLDPRVVEGVDAPITVLRVGSDGQLYQLRTSPTAGVSIARYSLGPTQAAPPTTPAPVPPPATGPPIDQGGVTAPTVTLPPAQPATRPASRLARWWIIPGLVALGAGALAALGMWLWYRRQHPAASRGPGRSRIAH